MATCYGVTDCTILTLEATKIWSLAEVQRHLFYILNLLCYAVSPLCLLQEFLQK